MADDDFPSGGSGAPEGLDKTQDWSEITGQGVPDGLDKTADWTGLTAGLDCGRIKGVATVAFPWEHFGAWND